MFLMKYYLQLYYSIRVMNVHVQIVYESVYAWIQPLYVFGKIWSTPSDFERVPRQRFHLVIHLAKETGSVTLTWYELLLIVLAFALTSKY